MDSSGVTAEALEAKLKQDLQATHVKATDTSGGCGQKFEVIVVSSKFEGLSLLQRHRLVNSCLADYIKRIHAFSQKTYAPDQWSSLGT